MTMTSQSIVPYRWPAFIIVLIAGFAAFSWWSIDRAASQVSAVSDPDYYAHGLKYHSASLDAKASATAGWTVTPQLAGKALIIEVRDATHQAIAGCQAIITFPPGQTAARMPIAPIALTDTGDGRYSGTLPAGLPTSVSATLTLNKDQATAQRQILINQNS